MQTWLFVDGDLPDHDESLTKLTKFTTEAFVDEVIVHAPQPPSNQYRLGTDLMDHSLSFAIAAWPDGPLTVICYCCSLLYDFVIMLSWSFQSEGQVFISP